MLQRGSADHATLADFMRHGGGSPGKEGGVGRGRGPDGAFLGSTLSGVQCLPVGGEHSVIYKDRGLRRALAAVLGRPGAIGVLEFNPGWPPVVQIAVRDKLASRAD